METFETSLIKVRRIRTPADKLPMEMFPDVLLEVKQELPLIAKVSFPVIIQVCNNQVYISLD